MDELTKFEFFTDNEGRPHYLVNGIENAVPSWVVPYKCVSVTVVRAMQVSVPFEIFNERIDSREEGKAGDYLAVKCDGQLCICPKVIFELTFEPLEKESEETNEED